VSLVEDWKDRMPTEVLSNGAIRYEQFDSSGNSLGYVYMKKADEPTEVGNVWNKSVYDGLKEAIEHKKYAIGTYTGNSNTDNVSQNVSIGFTPSAVIVIGGLASGGTASSRYATLSAMALTGSSYVYDNRTLLEIRENGFTVNNYKAGNGATAYFNENGITYEYIAFE